MRVRSAIRGSQRPCFDDGRPGVFAAGLTMAGGGLVLRLVFRPSWRALVPAWVVCVRAQRALSPVHEQCWRMHVLASGADVDGGRTLVFVGFALRGFQAACLGRMRARFAPYTRAARVCMCCGRGGYLGGRRGGRCARCLFQPAAGGPGSCACARSSHAPNFRAVGVRETRILLPWRQR